MKTQITQNIWAVGRNYAAHAAEMKSDVPTEPFVFLKSGACLDSGSKITLPAWSKDVHHEIEIAYWLDEDLKFGHVSLALDLTDRAAQSAAKNKGLPWTLAKSFKGACPIGPWLSLTDVPRPDDLKFQLIKNGQIQQSGHFQQMIFKPFELLEFVTKHYPVQPHDILLTGTPEGVGPLKSGDTLQAELFCEDRLLLACHWDVI